MGRPSLVGRPASGDGGEENVRIREENQTLATITLQNYFRLYDKLSGMTGTAMTEDAEFRQIYKLPVVGYSAGTSLSFVKTKRPGVPHPPGEYRSRGRYVQGTPMRPASLCLVGTRFGLKAPEKPRVCSASVASHGPDAKNHER